MTTRSTRRTFVQTTGVIGAGFRTILKTLAAPAVATFAGVRHVLGADRNEGLENEDVPAAGPMVGQVTSTLAAIWMYTPGGTSMKLTYKPQGAVESSTAKVEPIKTDDLNLRGRAWRALIADLAPNTRYQYEVAIDGKIAPEHHGTFKTAPVEGEPAKFRLGLTSCMKPKHSPDSWLLFAKDEPDLHLTIGDTVYADTTEPRWQWRHHLNYRRIEPFAKVIRTIPTYSMWDDHDYGPNNSDGTERGKHYSLDGWKRVWINPGAGTKDIPGAFYKFTWAQVEFFVVDGRYHRTPNKAKDDEKKTMLGHEQFAWLIEQLKASKAKFKVIVSGSTLDHSQNDGWRLYTHERRRLFDAIKSNKLNGVLYMSGSLHNSLAWEHHESDRVGYPFVEVISSGIANSKTLSYATIDFDTTVSDPALHVRVVAGNGKVREQKTWKLSTLSHG